MLTANQIILLVLAIVLIVVVFYIYRIVTAALTISSVSPLYNKNWKELSTDKQLAFENLGWDPKTWNTIDKSKLKNYPKTFKKPFSKLTKEEQKAAKALGHYSFSWWLQSKFM